MKRIYFVCITCIALLMAGCKTHFNPEETLKQKQNEAAALLTMLAQKPDSTGLRLIVANKLDSIGQYQNAVLQIDTLLKNDSLKYGLWVAKANVLLDSGDASAAKYSLRKAIAIFPGNEAVISLSEILAKEKNDSCFEVIRHFSGLSNVYENYIAALYAYQSNDLQKADSLLDKCLQHNHDFVKPFLLKGNILLQKKETEEAISFFNEGLKIEPKNIALLNNMANAFNQLKESDSVEEYFAKSLMVQAFQPKITAQFKALK